MGLSVGERASEVRVVRQKGQWWGWKSGSTEMVLETQLRKGVRVSSVVEQFEFRSPFIFQRIVELFPKTGTTHHISLCPVNKGRGIIDQGVSVDPGDKREGKNFELQDSNTDNCVCRLPKDLREFTETLSRMRFHGKESLGTQVSTVNYRNP